MDDSRRTFAEWLADCSRAAGYDIDSPRGGGRAALAEAAGMSRGQVSRALAGETQPDPKSLIGLAGALGVTAREMLIRSGTVPPEALPEPGAPAPPPVTEIDLYAVARKFSIPEEQIDLFVRLIESAAEQFASDRNGSSIRRRTQTGGRSAEGE